MRRAWTAGNDRLNPSYGINPVPACMRALDRLRGWNSRDGHSGFGDFEPPARALAPVVAIWIRPRLRLGRMSAARSRGAKRLYWIGRGKLGQPFAQERGRCHCSMTWRNTGQDVAKGHVSPSRITKGCFHTTTRSALMCSTTLACSAFHGKAGGRSRCCPDTVNNELLEHHRDVLAGAVSAVHVDRRGGLRKGCADDFHLRSSRPMVAFLLFRYPSLLRSKQAMKDRPTVDPGSAQRSTRWTQSWLGPIWRRVRFEPGDCTSFNNRWTLHNRTAFEDHAEPERRAILVRLWLQA